MHLSIKHNQKKTHTKEETFVTDDGWRGADFAVACHSFPLKIFIDT